MKNLVLVIMLSMVATMVNAQFSGISSAISNKDAAALSNFFGTSVEITTPEADAVFNKAEAISVMKKFFATYNPSSFKLVHQGSSKGKASEYAIGDMKAAGKSFRVFIYINETSGKTVIEQIQFEQD